MKTEKPDLWLYEHAAFADGFELVCGVDEAGRGPLAGPVCAAAVILPKDVQIEGLNDSKKLTDKKRRELFDVITASAVSYGIALVDEKTIDEINILQATFRAMAQAIAQLDPSAQLALVDGNRAADFGLPVRTIVKGDGLSASIAAASILAKVTRDRLMEQYAEQYPQYGFEIHKGYGTKRHYAALREFGPCPIHRMSFLKKFYGEKGTARPVGRTVRSGVSAPARLYTCRLQLPLPLRRDRYYCPESGISDVRGGQAAQIGRLRRSAGVRGRAQAGAHPRDGGALARNARDGAPAAV